MSSSTPEGNFKKSFCSKLRKLGCTVFQNQGVGIPKGFPDTSVLLPEGLTIYIEFKASKRAKFQSLQKEWIKKLTDRQYFAYVVYPEISDDIMEQIKRLI